MSAKAEVIPGLSPWNRADESFSEWTRRKDKFLADQRDERRQRELFRLALVNLPLKRYAVGVEFGVDPEKAEPAVHAYVVCRECYHRKPGLEEPRALVMDDAVRKLFPDNEVLAVGADLLTIIRSAMDHERALHGGRPH